MKMSDTVTVGREPKPTGGPKMTVELTATSEEGLTPDQLSAMRTTTPHGYRLSSSQIGTSESGKCLKARFEYEQITGDTVTSEPGENSVEIRARVPKSVHHRLKVLAAEKETDLSGAIVELWRRCAAKSDSNAHPEGVWLDAEFLPLGPDPSSGLMGTCAKITARGVRPSDRLAAISLALRDAYQQLGPPPTPSTASRSTSRHKAAR
jgi:hypothetical protein